MDLQSISQITTWGTAASVLNENFRKVRDVIESEKVDQSLAKGVLKHPWKTSRNAYPNPCKGDWAYVGTSFPAYTYTWNGTSWVKSSEKKQTNQEMYRT